MSFKTKIIAYGLIVGFVLLAPQLLFQDILQLEVSVLGTDYSAIVCWLLGIVIGSLLFGVVRMFSGTGKGGFGVMSLLRGGT